MDNRLLKEQKLCFAITEQFLVPCLVESSVRKSTDHENDMMVAQFVFLSLIHTIFQETSMEMKTKL